jgi:signal transduction histidine kinase
VAPRSLTFRIIALSSIWISLALVATAALLWHYYHDHIRKHYDAHVFMHLEEMIVASHLLPDGELELTAYPSDPRFDISGSGWYWEVRHHDNVLAASHSLNGKTLDLSGLPISEGVRVHEIAGPWHEVLRVQTMQIASGLPGEKLLLVASAPLMGITDDVIDIAEHMMISFIVLGLGLILAVVLQVRVALKPLTKFSKEISEIRAGKSDRLDEVFPAEVQLLANELNNLLEHNAVLLKRARNQLGDLAHSIKNPLTVISNEAHNLEETQRSLVLGKTRDIAKSVDHYLSRARASGSESVLGARANIKSVANDLAFALDRIYQDRKLEIDTSGLGNCSFRGEAQDLEEMLGNLMDNACKWARTRVRVRCTSELNRCLLTVEDDGPGIPDDQLHRVTERGHRLDDSKQGHGLGLGIVIDLLNLYDGELSFGRSELGGLRAELNIPGA